MLRAGWRRERTAVFNRVFRESRTEKVAFEKKPEEGERVSQATSRDCSYKKEKLSACTLEHLRNE